MFQRFTKDARAIATGATEIARELRAPTVEAEHLLLAATRLDTPAAATLHAAGLDYDGLLGALEAETARSLAAVGVSASTPRYSPFVKAPRFAASAKLALERSLKVSLARRDNFIGTEHVVAAILRAPTGTVPRALECAGVDRVDLLQRF
jgi:ATP-dependent Clp protease ATP-binding subunit ClpA